MFLDGERETEEPGDMRGEHANLCVDSNKKFEQAYLIIALCILIYYN